MKRISSGENIRKAVFTSRFSKVPPRIHHRVKRIPGSPALWKRTAADSFDPKRGREYDEYRQVNSTTSYVSRIMKYVISPKSGPNKLIAKLCSDFNKPNGQYRISNSTEEVKKFVQALQTRKMFGIGKVAAFMLKETFEIETIQDLYEKSTFDVSFQRKDISVIF